MKHVRLRIEKKEWRAYLARYPWEWLLGTYGKEMEGKAMVFLFPFSLKLGFHNYWGKSPIYVAFFDENYRIFALEKMLPGTKSPSYKCKGAIEWLSDPGDVVGKHLKLIFS
ncbi:MAG: DUF192 domain-containing protein [Candidatus Micrarchaeota archaeon]|nr:DUF192 domain-containing protein [Candidatus Micrarchaeota archaeon]